jgi:hypothetical protein
LPIPRCPMLRFVPDILDLIPPLQHRLELTHCFLARWTRSNFSFEGCGFWLDYPIRVGYQGMSLPTPGRVGETHSDLWKANHKNQNLQVAATAWNSATREPSIRTSGFPLALADHT